MEKEEYQKRCDEFIEKLSRGEIEHPRPRGPRGRITLNLIEGAK
jgi:hypothetical protein